MQRKMEQEEDLLSEEDEAKHRQIKEELIASQTYITSGFENLHNY